MKLPDQRQQTLHTVELPVGDSQGTTSEPASNMIASAGSHPRDNYQFGDRHYPCGRMFLYFRDRRSLS